MVGMVGALERTCADMRDCEHVFTCETVHFGLLFPPCLCHMAHTSQYTVSRMSVSRVLCVCSLLFLLNHVACSLVRDQLVER